LKFPCADFRADDRRFAIEIGNNRFDDSHLDLALDAPECQLAGEIHLGSLNPWPVTAFSPGVMGWYAWVPGMECYHGVLSFSHALEGGYHNVTRRTLRPIPAMVGICGLHHTVEKRQRVRVGGSRFERGAIDS